jgi:DNA-binding response OmpR family regulator
MCFMARILIIEDDMHINRIYAEKLKNEGYNIIPAVDGKEGVAIARTKEVDLILLDIMLPGLMNGFEVLEVLKKDEKLKNIPVIILTNLDTEKGQAEKYGIKDYLVKADTGLNKLVSMVKKYVQPEQKS